MEVKSDDPFEGIPLLPLGNRVVAPVRKAWDRYRATGPSMYKTLSAALYCYLVKMNDEQRMDAMNDVCVWSKEQILKAESDRILGDAGKPSAPGPDSKRRSGRNRKAK